LLLRNPRFPVVARKAFAMGSGRSKGVGDAIGGLPGTIRDAT
jgi:hypothetical protein